MPLTLATFNVKNLALRRAIEAAASLLPAKLDEIARLLRACNADVKSACRRWVRPELPAGPRRPARGLRLRRAGRGDVGRARYPVRRALACPRRGGARAHRGGSVLSGVPRGGSRALRRAHPAAPGRRPRPGRRARHGGGGRVRGPLQVGPSGASAGRLRRRARSDKPAEPRRRAAPQPGVALRGGPAHARPRRRRARGAPGGPGRGRRGSERRVRVAGGACPSLRRGRGAPRLHRRRRAWRAVQRFSPRPPLQIDHVFATANLRAVLLDARFLNGALRDHGAFDPLADEASTVDSDHAPLVVRFG